jgi:hypothetical protein
MQKFRWDAIVLRRACRIGDGPVGDAASAAAGSAHTDFETDTGATYIVIIKI